MTENNRKLAAILFADIVGYTALMQKDEQTASNLLRHFQQQLEEKVSTFNGRIVNFYGDGALCTFQIPIDAVRCAMALQTTFNTSPRTPVRIGIHSGTVTLEGDKIFGDSVNITSRIESMGIAGGILFSKKVRDDVKNNPDLAMISLGSFEFKNVDEPMEVFALANEGFVVPKQTELQGKFKNREQSFKFWKILLPLCLFFVAGTIGWQYYNKEKKPLVSANEAIEQQEPSIGVLPFTNLSADENLDYFNTGIREDLISQLIRLKELNVYATEVANLYKTSPKTPLEIGAEMKVDYLLIGSSRMENQQKIVNPKLLHIASGKYIWGDTFKEGELPIASFQNEIVKLVAMKLQLELSPKQKKTLNTLPTKNEAAYDLYLRSFDLSMHEVEPSKEGIKLMEEAIKLDPNFSKAYSKLSSFYWMLAAQSTEPPLPNWKKSKQMAEKAILLDPDNADGWNNLGITQTNFDWDFIAAEKSYLKALALDPKNRIDYCVYLWRINQPQKATDEILLGIKLAPELKSFYDLFLVGAYIREMQFENAKQLINKYDMENSSEFSPLFRSLQYYGAVQNIEKGIEIAQKIRRINPVRSHTFLGYFYGRKGNIETAQNYLDSLNQISLTHFVSPTYKAYVHFGMGNDDLGYETLQEAYSSHDSNLMDIQMNSPFEIRDHPRYIALLEKIGFPKTIKN